MLIWAHWLKMIDFSKFYDKEVRITYLISLNQDPHSCILLNTICSNTLFGYK